MRTVEELADKVVLTQGRWVLHVSPEEMHTITEHRRLNDVTGSHADTWTFEMRSALAKRFAPFGWENQDVPDIRLVVDFVGGDDTPDKEVGNADR